MILSKQISRLSVNKRLLAKRSLAMSYMDSLSDGLSMWIQDTIESQDQESIKQIRALWDNESWESIMKKVSVEGSVWYVWWMDGVCAFRNTLPELG